MKNVVVLILFLGFCINGYAISYSQDEIEQARETLGVSSDASLKTIKRAARKLLHQYHPDKKNGPEKEKATEKTQEINEAVGILEAAEKAISHSPKQPIQSVNEQVVNISEDYKKYIAQNLINIGWIKYFLQTPLNSFLSRIYRTPEKVEIPESKRNLNSFLNEHFGPFKGQVASHHDILIESLKTFDIIQLSISKINAQHKMNLSSAAKLRAIDKILNSSFELRVAFIFRYSQGEFITPSLEGPELYRYVYSKEGAWAEEMDFIRSAYGSDYEKSLPKTLISTMLFHQEQMAKVPKAKKMLFRSELFLLSCMKSAI